MAVFPDSSSVSRARRLATGLPLAALSVVLCVGLGELALRASAIPGYQPYAAGKSPYIEPDPVLGWRNVPSFSGQLDWGRVEHDARGFRDDPGRRPEASRLLVLGDSYAWGLGVDQRELFSRHLEQAVNGLQVVNAGVSGYSTDQELLLFEQVAETVSPDRVLLFAFSNDEIGNLLRVNYRRYPKPRFRIEEDDLKLESAPEALPLVSRLVDGGYRHSALFTALAFHWRTAKVFPFPLLREAANRLQGIPRNRPARLWKLLIERMRDRARSLDATFGIVLVVNQDQVVKNSDLAFRQRLKALGPELGVPVLDLTNAFERHVSSGGPSLDLGWDDHWSPAAHRLVAEEVTRFLSRLND